MNPNDEKLAQFVEDTVMYHAVKAILFEKCDLNTIPAELPYTDLAPTAKAYMVARTILENGFKELQKYKRHDTDTQLKDNPNGI